MQISCTFSQGGTQRNYKFVFNISEELILILIQMHNCISFHKPDNKYEAPNIWMFQFHMTIFSLIPQTLLILW